MSVQASLRSPREPASAGTTRMNSLFQKMISLFQRNNCLFRAEQGIVPSALELQRKRTPERGEKHRNGRKFQKFPVIFPATRELAYRHGTVSGFSPAPQRPLPSQRTRICVALRTS
jgi:hypothetical protein